MRACTKPPRGWLCTRDADHEGPCAAERDWGGHRAITFVLPVSAEASTHLIETLVDRILMDWVVYGQVHITNAGGLTRLDPQRIKYEVEG